MSLSVSMNEFISAAENFEKVFEEFEANPSGRAFLEGKGRFREVLVMYLKMGISPEELKENCEGSERIVKKIEELMIKNKGEKLFKKTGHLRLSDDEKKEFKREVTNLRKLEDEFHQDPTSKRLFENLWLAKKTYKSIGRALKNYHPYEELQIALKEAGLRKSNKVLKKVYKA